MNGAITWGIGIGGLVLCYLGIIVWGFFIMRPRYLREIKGKMKGIFFSEGNNMPDEQILEVLPSGMEVQAPKGHHIGTYYINRQCMWETMYPSKPFLGMWFTQVPIATHWWAVDNPEPMSRHKVKEVATPQQIFASGDSTFMFALRQAKAELEQERKEILKLTKNKLNPMYIYIGLAACAVLAGGALFMAYNVYTRVPDILQAVGAK